MLSPEDSKFIKRIRKCVELTGDTVDANEIIDLLAIIRKQSQALEKCKEQRDELCRDLNYGGPHALAKMIQVYNKELAAILGGEGK